MKWVWLGAAGFNATLFTINIISERWWLAVINMIATALCVLNFQVRNRNKEESKS